MHLLQCTATRLRGSRQWISCYAPPHSLGEVGNGTHAMHYLNDSGQWVVALLQCTATLLGGIWQWNSDNARPHCLGAVGGATAAMHCLIACG